MAGRPLMLATLLGASIGVPYVVSRNSRQSERGRNVTPSAQKLGLAHVGNRARIRDNSTAPVAVQLQHTALFCGPANLSVDRDARRLTGLTRPSPAQTMRYHSIQEVLRFDVSKEWVYQNWDRKSTGLGDPELFGIRVALVTGTQRTDLAGSLTYLFDGQGQVQHISFRGRTADTTPLVQFLTQTYQFQRMEAPPASSCTRSAVAATSTANCARGRNRCCWKRRRRVVLAWCSSWGGPDRIASFSRRYRTWISPKSPLRRPRRVPPRTLRKMRKRELPRNRPWLASCGRRPRPSTTRCSTDAGRIERAARLLCRLRQRSAILLGMIGRPIEIVPCPPALSVDALALVLADLTPNSGENLLQRLRASRSKPSSSRSTTANCAVPRGDSGSRGARRSSGRRNVTSRADEVAASRLTCAVAAALDAAGIRMTQVLLPERNGADRSRARSRRIRTVSPTCCT